MGSAARVVEVIADQGASAAERYRYGSGCIVAGRTVLTAGHVVAGAASVTVRFPDKHEVPAWLEERFVVVTAAVDLALVEIDDLTVDLPPLPIARVRTPRSSSKCRWSAIHSLLSGRRSGGKPRMPTGTSRCWPGWCPGC